MTVEIWIFPDAENVLPKLLTVSTLPTVGTLEENRDDELL